jgi:hypothetical protein
MLTSTKVILGENSNIDANLEEEGEEEELDEEDELM